MPTARLGLAACTDEKSGLIYAIGGYASANSPGLTTVEAYDPESDSWTTKTPMPTGRRWLACAVAGGKVYAVGDRIYVIGGTPNGSTLLTTVEEYDTSTDMWATKESMPTARALFAASAVDSVIFAIGGLGTSVGVRTVEAYDPQSDDWSAKADMLTPRAALASAASADASSRSRADGVRRWSRTSNRTTPRPICGPRSMR